MCFVNTNKYKSHEIRSQMLETRIHFFKNCVQNLDIFCLATLMVEDALKKKIDEAAKFTMSFGIGDSKINTVAMWLLVNVFEMMHSSGIVDPILLLERTVNEIDWIIKDVAENMRMHFQH